MLSELKETLMGVWGVATQIVSDSADLQDLSGIVNLTPKDIDFAEGLTAVTFTDFPQDKLDDSWIMVPAQESHAKKILEASPNLRSIRFELCPRLLSDETFWQIYFAVAQGDVMGLSDVEGEYLLLHSAPLMGHDAVLLPSPSQDKYLVD